LRIILHERNLIPYCSNLHTTNNPVIEQKNTNTIRTKHTHPNPQLAKITQEKNINKYEPRTEHNSTATVTTKT